MINSLSGRSEAVGDELLLQVLDPEAGHVELVLHLPQVGVAERVLAPVGPEHVLRLQHRPSEAQGLAHALEGQGGALQEPDAMVICGLLKALASRHNQTVG